MQLIQPLNVFARRARLNMSKCVTFREHRVPDICWYGRRISLRSGSPSLLESMSVLFRIMLGNAFALAQTSPQLLMTEGVAMSATGGTTVGDACECSSLTLIDPTTCGECGRR